MSTGFSITEFQHQAHTSLVEAQKKERQHDAGLRGAFGHWMKKQLAQVKFWPAWKRDGFESEVHYMVARRRATLVYALEQGEIDHPMWELAMNARALKLI